MPQDHGYLRGTVENAIITALDPESIDDSISTGVRSMGLAPSMTLIYHSIGNVEEATYELKRNLFELRYSLILGRENLAIIGNGTIVAAGIYTGGRSAIQLTITNSPTAKGFYTASAVFSAVAVTNGGMAVMARACKISEVAVLSEAVGAGFMFLGNIAHVAALQAEGKPVPPHLQRFKKANIRAIRRSRYNNPNLGFIMPGQNFASLSDIIGVIPFEQIGKVVGFSITVYGYYKMVVVGYRYSQKLIAKYIENRQKTKLKTKLKNGLITKQAQFLVVSFYCNPSVRRTLLIHKFINSNSQFCY